MASFFSSPGKYVRKVKHRRNPYGPAKPDKKSTDVVPVTLGSSLHTRRMATCLNMISIRSSMISGNRSIYNDVPGSRLNSVVQEPGMLPVWCVPLDIVDEGDHYSIHAELPRFTRDQVDVQVNDDALSIKVQKSQKKKRRKRTTSTTKGHTLPSKIGIIPRRSRPGKGLEVNEQEGSLK